MFKEKRLEFILVDVMCVLVVCFFDDFIFINLYDGKEKRLEFGQVFVWCVKVVMVDIFLCLFVVVVQVCFLMVYEGFGVNQDSVFWMYLGLVIRMVVDFGFQKLEGVKY